MSFYPEGWTYERLLDATSEELLTLPDTQRFALFDGLKALHGEDGYREILQEMDRRCRARIEATESEETKQQRRELLAPFVQSLDLVFRFQCGDNKDWGKWGFVVFRTTPYGGEHDTQWAEFRKRWDAVIEDGLAPHRGSMPKVDRAIDLIEFQWVEQPELEGADATDVAKRYNEMVLPHGLSNSACLMVTPASMESVLSSPLPSSAPRRERRRIPFVVAVSSGLSVAHLQAFIGLDEEGLDEEDVAGADFKGYLNVAVENILDEFHPLTALQYQDLHELMPESAHENDIWCSGGRFGIHHYEES
ncbi:unnamed protein product [Penicillium glandicola]